MSAVEEESAFRVPHLADAIELVIHPPDPVHSHRGQQCLEKAISCKNASTTRKLPQPVYRLTISH